MAILSGKQREIVERDKLFLEVARTIFLQESFHDLTIGRIAQATGFSKGTVYQRFSCKEELIVELGIQGYEHLLSILQQAAAFSGRPRERIVAMGEVLGYYWAEYKDTARILAVFDSEPVLTKVRPELQAQLELRETHIFDFILNVVNEAIELGDLTIPSESTAKSLCFSLWALADGWVASRWKTGLVRHAGILNPLKDILRNAHRLMDAYEWRPLYDEWDYGETARKVRALFLAESPADDTPQQGLRNQTQPMETQRASANPVATERRAAPVT